MKSIASHENLKEKLIIVLITPKKPLIEKKTVHVLNEEKKVKNINFFALLGLTFNIRCENRLVATGTLIVKITMIKS